MKFILYKNAKHIKLESKNGAIISKLQNLFNSPKINIKGIAITTALATAFLGATPAMAIENNIKENVHETVNEQIITDTQNETVAINNFNETTADIDKTTKQKENL